MSNSPPTLRRRFAEAARDPRAWRRTLLLGLPIGLLQATLNQGDHWWHRHVDALVVLKTILSPLLSCTTAFVSAALTSSHEPPDPPSV
ncbi:MAG: hypothetical protein V4773_26540 [Verrucomicrobiota bacterium]